MEHFQTDTADYADIVLPATTQLEHSTCTSRTATSTCSANNPAIAPLGESLPNTEVFRRLAARMGFDEPCFRDSDEESAARRSSRAVLSRACAASTGTRLKQRRMAAARRAARASRRSPQGGFPTPSGKCELYSAALAKQGIDPLPFYNPPRRSRPDETLAERFPLAFISPPARHFLNSSFANLARFREFEREPHLDMHPTTRRRAASATATRVRVFNDRGGYTLKARVNGKPRAGRGGRAFGVVEEIRARRRQRQQRHLAAHHRPRRRRHVLRLPRAGRTCRRISSLARLAPCAGSRASCFLTGCAWRSRSRLWWSPPRAGSRSARASST